MIDFNLKNFDLFYEEDYIVKIQQEYNQGMYFINKLKKYKNKTITLNKLNKLFNLNGFDFASFEDKYYETLYIDGDTTGIYDVISLDECYIGFTYEILPKDKIKIKGFYKDS